MNLPNFLKFWKIIQSVPEFRLYFIKVILFFVKADHKSCSICCEFLEIFSEERRAWK